MLEEGSVSYYVWTRELEASHHAVFIDSAESFNTELCDVDGIWHLSALKGVPQVSILGPIRDCITKDASDM